MARVCWDGWSLAYCVDVEDRVRAYGESERVLARYLKMSNQQEWLFKTVSDLSIFCGEKGIDLRRAFSSDLEEAVRVFHCYFRRGLMMMQGGLCVEVASSRGAHIGEGHYPAMEVDGVRWAVLKTRKRRYIIEKVFLRIPALELDVVETQILKESGDIDR